MIKAGTPGRNSRPPDFKTSQAGGPFAEVWRRGRGDLKGRMAWAGERLVKQEDGLSTYSSKPINLWPQPINL